MSDDNQPSSPNASLRTIRHRRYASALLFLLLIAVVGLARPAKTGDAAAAASGAH